MGKVKKRPTTDFKASRAALTAQISESRSDFGETSAYAVAVRQLGRGDQIAEEGSSASSISVFADGQKTLDLLSDAVFGRRQKDSARLGGMRTNKKARERRADLVNAISPVVHQMRRKNPSLSDHRIATILVKNHSDFCRYQFAKGIEKTYSVRHLRRIITEDILVR